MDNDLKAYLDAMETRINDGQERLLTRFTDIVNEGQERLLTRFNDGQESLLNRLNSLEADFQNTKGFLVDDAIVSGRRWFEVDRRLSRVERNK
jgi:hypothetical protein